jgi:hypothetical protein
MKPGDTVNIRGGTFTAAEESTEHGAHACTGCAGKGKHRKALCAVLTDCGNDRIIWVASNDPATTVAIAEFELEST